MNLQKKLILSLVLIVFYFGGAIIWHNRALFAIRADVASHPPVSIEAPVGIAVDQTKTSQNFSWQKPSNFNPTYYQLLISRDNNFSAGGTAAFLFDANGQLIKSVGELNKPAITYYPDQSQLKFNWTSDKTPESGFLNFLLSDNENFEQYYLTTNIINNEVTVYNDNLSRSLRAKEEGIFSRLETGKEYYWKVVTSDDTQIVPAQHFIFPPPSVANNPSSDNNKGFVRKNNAGHAQAADSQVMTITLSQSQAPSTADPKYYQSTTSWITKSDEFRAPGSLSRSIQWTDNGGTSWNQCATPPLVSQEYISAIHFESIYEGWILTDQGRVYRTTNKGTGVRCDNWQLIGGAGQGSTAITFSDLNNGQTDDSAGTLNNGYYTNNSGISWSSGNLGSNWVLMRSIANAPVILYKTNTPLPSGYENFGHLGINGTDYILGPARKLYNSSSSELDKYKLNAPGDYYWKVSYTLESDQQKAIDSLTSVNGVSWSPFSAIGNYFVADLAAKSTITSSPKINAVLNEKGESIMVPIATTLDVNHYISSDSWVTTSDGYRVNGSNDVKRTNDGGANWNKISCGDLPTPQPQLVAVHFNDIDNGWVVGNAGEFFSTADACQTWTKKGKIDSVGAQLSISFSDALNGLLYDISSGKYYSTADAGTTWTSASLGDKWIKDDQNNALLLYKIGVPLPVGSQIFGRYGNEYILGPSRKLYYLPTSGLKLIQGDRYTFQFSVTNPPAKYYQMVIDNRGGSLSCFPAVRGQNNFINTNFGTQLSPGGYHLRVRASELDNISPSCQNTFGWSPLRDILTISLDANPEETAITTTAISTTASVTNSATDVYPPTIQLKETVITAGQSITFYGGFKPGQKLVLKVNSEEKSYETTASDAGKWEYTISGGVDAGVHSARAIGSYNNKDYDSGEIKFSVAASSSSSSAVAIVTSPVGEENAPAGSAYNPHGSSAASSAGASGLSKLPKAGANLWLNLLIALLLSAITTYLIFRPWKKKPPVANVPSGNPPLNVS